MWHFKLSHMMVGRWFPLHNFLFGDTDAAENEIIKS